MKTTKRAKDGLRGIPHELKKCAPYYLMALPAVIVVFFVAYLPFPGMIIAFKDYNFSKGIWGSAWAGLDNFRFFFTSDYALRTTVNTLWINFNYLFWTTLSSVTVAIALNEIRAKRLVKVYQNAMFLPYFLSVIIVAKILTDILFPRDFGLINQIVTFFGGDKIDWLTTPSPWVSIVVSAHTWQVLGYNVIIYLASISGIDEEIYEASSLDGAGRLQRIFHITLPMLTPSIIMLSLLSIGRMLYGDFGLIFAITDQRPILYARLDIIETYIFRAVKETADFGTSSAVGLYQSLVGFILVFGSNFLAKRFDKDYGLF